MKKLLIVGTMFALSGCAYQVVSNEDIERAEKACKSVNSEIEEISSSFLGVEIVTCKNNKQAYLSSVME